MRFSPRGPRAVTLVIGMLVMAGLTVVGLLYQPPYLVLGPGPTANVSTDVVIEGVWSEENRGTYLLTTVSTWRPNAFEFAWASLQDKDIVALTQVVPPDQTPAEYSSRQRRVFDESRVVAAAAAARVAGLDVEITGTGARVEGVVPGSPAEEVLRAGDVIVSVDGEAIDLTSDLQKAIGSQPPGTSHSITVERDGDELQRRIRSRPLDGGVSDVRSGIGVLVSTRDFDIQLPFKITFAERDIGGPSAGLAYALAITDMLKKRDYADGIVGATGTIAVDGGVGPVGSVDQKAMALRRAGAELFLVPQEQIGTIEPVDGLEIRGVARLEGALRLLRQEIETAV